MRLSQEKIYEIVKARHEGEKRSAIAERFSVDASTVSYHEERFLETYGTTAVVYQLIPQQKVCECPSVKCMICGRHHDLLNTRDRQRVQQLTRALKRANERLAELGSAPVEPGTV